MTLNSFIRESEFLQNMIVYHGLGRKYWNTIIPYVKSGRIQKVINYEYDFPFRLAFFPGMMIMLVTLSLNLLSSWLRILLDPVQNWRLKTYRKFDGKK